MFQKSEIKAINTDFWQGFKKYMQKTKSSNGRKINWLNYPSDVKDIYIRMEVDGKSAALCFDIQSKDPEIRALIWDQMIELQKLIDKTVKWDSIWIENLSSKQGVLFSRIKWEKENLSLFNKDDYSVIYKFLSERLIEFDLFYQEYKEILINLVH
jgi:hypothetical protein